MTHSLFKKKYIQKKGEIKMGRKKELKKAIKAVEKIKNIDPAVKRYFIIAELESVDKDLPKEKYKEKLEKILQSYSHWNEKPEEKEEPKVEGPFFTKNPITIHTDLSEITRMFCYNDGAKINSGDIYLVNAHQYDYGFVNDIMIDLSNKILTYYDCSEVGLNYTFTSNENTGAFFELMTNTKRINFEEENEDITVPLTPILREVEKDATDAKERLKDIIESKLKNSSIDIPKVMFIDNISDIVKTLDDGKEVKEFFSECGNKYDCIFVCYTTRITMMKLLLNTTVDDQSSLHKKNAEEVKSSVDTIPLNKGTKKKETITKAEQQRIAKAEALNVYETYVNDNFIFTGNEKDTIFVSDFYEECQKMCEDIGVMKLSRNDIYEKLVSLAEKEGKEIKRKYKHLTNSKTGSETVKDTNRKVIVGIARKN